MLIGIDQERKRELVSVAKFAMAFGALRIDSEDDQVQAACVRPCVAELAQLLAADQGVITRIEDQYDILAPQSRQFYFLARFGWQGEIGSLGTNL